MHVGELLGDRRLWAVFLLSQPLYSPDIGKKLADFLSYILAILLGHIVTASGTIPKLFRVSSG